MKNRLNIHICRLARICLLRSVVPDGSVILYRPSCSGNTRRTFGFDSVLSDTVLSEIFTENGRRPINYYFEMFRNVKLIFNMWQLELERKMYGFLYRSRHLLGSGLLAADSTNGVTFTVVMDCFSSARIFSRVFCSYTFFACLWKWINSVSIYLLYHYFIKTFKWALKCSLTYRKIEIISPIGVMPISRKYSLFKSVNISKSIRFS